MATTRRTLIRRSPAELLAWSIARKHSCQPPTEPGALCRWLKHRPQILSWVVSHRPAEAIALGLIERPLPAVIDSLRHHSLPLDPRQEANLRRCLQLAGITAAELELGLSDRPHILQTALQLLSDADDAAG